MARLSGGAGFRNLKSVRKQIRSVMQQFRKSVPAATYVIGVEIIRDAKKRAPLDTGQLRDSGYVSYPRQTKRGANITMGFGGPAAAYAVRQHEETSWFHSHGEAKYFEKAIYTVGPSKGLRSAVHVLNSAINSGRAKGINKAADIPYTPWG